MGTQNKHIVLADPSLTFRQLYSSILAKEGFAVTAVANEAELRAVLRQRACDLVIIDPMIAGKDAIPFIRKMSAAAPSTRIVIFTSITDPRWVEVASYSGIADYLVKGQISPNVVVSRLEEIVSWNQFEEDPNRDETSITYLATMSPA